MSYQWRVGEKAVCIYTNWYTKSDPSIPQRGEVYTIENIIPEGDGIGFQLFEIINPPRWFFNKFGECAFSSKGFRPLTNTSIEVFQKLLAPKQKERKHEPA